jgi:steroid delta-isomerase-like uncharacterized protein
MKKFLVLALAAFLFINCKEKGPLRYTQQSAEIDTVKSLINNYNNKTYDLTVYADTAKTMYNSNRNQMSPSETKAYHMAADANFSSRGFVPEGQEYEMAITDDGETWVNFWGEWQGTLAANHQKITIPTHLTYQFKDGKIVREVGYWDSSAIVLALQEIEMEKNRSADQKAIQSTVGKVVKAWNTHDKALLEAATVKNIIRKSNGIKAVNNQTEYSNFMDQYFAAFPDFHVKIDKTLLEGNTAYINWTVKGTNTGKFMGNAPTNKKIEVHGLSIWKFDREGKAIQEDAYSDKLEVYQQLGYSMPALK